MKRRVVIILLAVFCPPVLLGVLLSPPADKVEISAAGVVSQSYILIDKLSFGSFWSLGGVGNSNGGFGPPPINNAIHFGFMAPIPTSMHAYWFNVSQQQFYVAEFNNPDLPAKAATIAERYPRRLRMRFWLMVAIADTAEVQLWLCGSGPMQTMPTPKQQEEFKELLYAVQGHVAGGDASFYAVDTKQARREGWVPPHPLPVPKQAKQPTKER